MDGERAAAARAMGGGAADGAGRSALISGVQGMRAVLQRAGQNKIGLGWLATQLELGVLSSSVLRAMAPLAGDA